MPAEWTGSSHGVEWRLALEREDLLPGRLVAGRLELVTRASVDARGLVVALRAVEHWKHEVSTTDAQGHTSTRVETTRRELVRQPVQLEGSLRLGAGESRSWTFELPVPPLGPASLDADVAGLDWTVEAKLDVPAGLDTGIEGEVRVLQPVGLLRAGAVPVGQFALFGAADVIAGGITGTVTIDPVPLCSGRPFTAVALLRADGTTKLQEVRAELRVRVEATVSGGLEETIVAWAGSLPITAVTGEQSIELAGTVSPRALPTIALPHGRTSATFHLILATAWAPDPHLVRDVAMATTLEV